MRSEVSIKNLCDFIMSERVASDGGYVYSQDIRHTTLNRDGIQMDSVYFLFEGEGVVILRLEFTVNQSMKLQEYRKEYQSIGEAVKGFLTFHDDNRLCAECGVIAPVGKDCVDCKLFKIWGEYHGANHVCVICQEPVWKLRLSCGHHFHMTCINAMCPDNIVKCPVCRKELTTYEIETIFLEETSDEV